LSAAKDPRIAYLHLPLRDIFTPPSLVILTEEAHNLIVGLAVEKPASLPSGFPERFFNSTRRPWQPHENKLQKPVPFFQAQKYGCFPTTFTTQFTTTSPRFTTTLHHKIRKNPCKTATPPHQN
jgi:hypothetical protein